MIPVSSPEELTEILEENGFPVKYSSGVITVRADVKEFVFRFPDTVILQTRFSRVYISPSSLSIISQSGNYHFTFTDFFIDEVRYENNQLLIYFHQ